MTRLTAALVLIACHLAHVVQSQSVSAGSEPVGPWCGCPGVDETTCFESPQNFNIEERLDCGPYVPKLYDSGQTCVEQTDDGCGSSGGVSLTEFGIDNDRMSEVSPPDPVMSAEELDDYKTLELQLLAEILKSDPLFPEEGETTIDLPYCGAATEEQASANPGRKRGEPVYASPAIYKRGWGNIFKGIKWPSLSSGPKRPQFMRPPQVRVVFNVLATNHSSSDIVSDAVLTNLVGELNRNYRSMKITFTLNTEDIYRHVDPEDADLRRFTQHERDYDDNSWNENYMMREEFRYGGKETLHVYVLESIKRKNGSGRVNGFCYFPHTEGVDGCAIAYDTIGGVSHQDCDTRSRGTLTHEAGHWFGLKHTHDDRDTACTGDNEISVIPQFPDSKRFCDLQNPCSTGSKPQVQTGVQAKMTNFMSYAWSRGGYVLDVGPWVKEQRSKAWTNFYKFRPVGRSAKRSVGSSTPTKRMMQSFGPVHPGPSLYSRVLKHREANQRWYANGTLSARGIFTARPNIREELIAICQTPGTDPDPSIDANIPDQNNDSSIVPAPREDDETPGTKPPGTDTGNPTKPGTGTDKGTGTETGIGTGTGNGNGGNESGGSNSASRNAGTTSAILGALIAIFMAI